MISSSTPSAKSILGGLTQPATTNCSCRWPNWSVLWRALCRQGTDTLKTQYPPLSQSTLTLPHPTIEGQHEMIYGQAN